MLQSRTVVDQTLDLSQAPKFASRNSTRAQARSLRVCQLFLLHLASSELNFRLSSLVLVYRPTRSHCCPLPAVRHCIPRSLDTRRSERDPSSHRPPLAPTRPRFVVTCSKSLWWLSSHPLPLHRHHHALHYNIKNEQHSPLPHFSTSPLSRCTIGSGTI